MSVVVFNIVIIASRDFRNDLLDAAHESVLRILKIQKLLWYDRI